MRSNLFLRKNMTYDTMEAFSGFQYNQSNRNKFVMPNINDTKLEFCKNNWYVKLSHIYIWWLYLLLYLI